MLLVVMVTIFSSNLILISGYLNDLWKYSPSTNQWTWVSGNNTASLGVYGTQGVSSSFNFPGSRGGSVIWIDSNGTLWLFGGVRFATGGGKYI